MKTRILSIILILLLCLTAGCGKVSQESEKPDGISSSESKTEESSASESSQAEEQTSAQTTEQQSVAEADSTTTEEAESDKKWKTDRIFYTWSSPAITSRRFCQRHPGS